MTDHHARHARLDRRTDTAPRSASRTRPTHVRPFVGGERQRAKTREVLRRSARTASPSPRANADSVERRAELPRAERPVREVEHRGKVDVDRRCSSARSGRPAGVEEPCLAPGLAGRLLRRRVPNVFTSPPSWSVKTGAAGSRRVPVVPAARSRRRHQAARAGRRRRADPPSAAASGPPWRPW